MADLSKPRARRTSRLSQSLKGLPTVVREIIHPERLVAPGEFRLLGEETHKRLHVKPAAFTLEIIKRLTHIRKNQVDAVPLTAPLEPCLLPGSMLTPSLGAHLLTQKFCYHSTFYREQWKFKAAPPPARPVRAALHRCQSRQNSGNNARGALLTAYF